MVDYLLIHAMTSSTLEVKIFFMRIGDVAKQCGLQASAIRYYEEAGLLPKPSRTSGRRIYDASILHRIAFIQFARTAGFSVRETRLLAEALRPKQPLSARLQQLAARKIEEVERLILQAQFMKSLLTQAMQCRCIDVEECGRKIQKLRGARTNGSRRDRRATRP